MRDGYISRCTNNIKLIGTELCVLLLQLTPLSVTINLANGVSCYICISVTSSATVRKW